MGKARPEHATPETLQILTYLTKRWGLCQRIISATHHFCVSIGAEDARFIEIVMMGLMYIDNLPILHIIDESTRFSAVRFLPTVSTIDICKTLLRCWASIYTGLPNRVLIDHGSQLD